MSIELYPSIAKIKRNGVYENLPGFVPETGAVATQQMIATSESSATAQYVHNKGEYFRLNDTLYQAIVKINVGDAIVVGTNCEVAVLGNDVTHIANSIAEYELGIATAPHATGEYFMVGETMYVATNDIAIGDSISTSTNCRIAVVGDELSGLHTAMTEENLFEKFNAQVLTYTGGENSYNDGVTEIWENKSITSSGAIFVDANSVILVIPVYDLTAKYSLLGFNSNQTVYINQTSQVACLDSSKSSLGLATAVTNGVTIPYPNTMFLGFRMSNPNFARGIPMIIKNWDGVNKTAYVDYTPTVPVITEIPELEKDIAYNSVFNAFSETANLMNLATITDNAVISNTGALSENSAYATSDFIPVTVGENYIGNFTNHLAWYKADKTFISRSNQVYSATAPTNAAYARIDWHKGAITSDKIMFIKGTELPAEYIPHLLPIYADLPTSQWYRKVWATYGDSITAAANGDTLANGWAKYVNDEIPFGAYHGRGIGAQKFSWGTNGGSVAFVNSTTGAYNSRNDSYNKDNYEGDVPEGCVAIRGAFCSWDRITHMFPESIKDTIDMIFIMGSTNDSNDSTALAWVANDTTDTEWAESSYYETYGGDYNIATLAGGVASTIMKMQAWMPQAAIIIASAFNGQTNDSGHIKPGTIPDEYEKSEVVMQTARKFGCPQVDVFGTCNVNVLNSPTYISDGTHPNNTVGFKALARAVIMGVKNIYPLAE